MPADRDELDITIRARNLASGAIREVQADFEKLLKGMNRARAEAYRRMFAALRDPGLAKDTREIFETTLRRARLPIPDIAKQVAEQAKGAAKTAADSARQMLVSFQPATYAINLLGAGTLRLADWIGIAISAFVGLGSIAVKAIRSIISAILRLVRTIINMALSALRRLAQALALVGGVGTAVVGILARVGIGFNAFIEQHRMAFSVLRGSREEGEKLTAWLLEYARLYRLKPAEVLPAGRELEAYGLAAERYLSLAANLSAAVGEPIERAVTLLAQAKAGVFDLRQYSSLGITRERLMSVGVKFEKTGEPLGREQLLAGVEAVVARDFPDMIERTSTQLGRIWNGIVAQAVAAAGDITAGAYQVLRSGGDQLLESWDKLGRSDVWERIKERAGGALAFVADQVMGLIDLGPQLAARFADMLDRAPIEEFLASAIALARFLYYKLTEVVGKVSEFLQESFRTAGINVESVWQGIAIIIAKAAAALAAMITTFIEEWPKIKAWIVNAIGVIVGIAHAAFDIIRFLLQGVFKPLEPLLALIKLVPDAIAKVHGLALKVKAAFADSAAEAEKLREKATRLWESGWRGYFEVRVGEDMEPFSIADFAARLADNVKAAIAAVPGDLAEITPEIKLPSLKDLVDRDNAAGQFERAAKDGTAEGVRKGVKDAADDFLHQVWGATSEMLRKAGLTPQYYAQIGAPILAGAGAQVGVPLDVNVTVREDLRAALHDPGKKRDFEMMIEEAIEDWARRHRG